MRLVGACSTLTFLLRRTICVDLRRSRPKKILNVFQRIRLRFFQACGLASGRTSFASSRTAMSDRLLARIIHEGFYYNRRYAATTSLTAGGLAARSVNILFQVCLPPSWARPRSLPYPLLQGGQPPCRIPTKGVCSLRNSQAGQHRLVAPRACLAWRLGGFVTNPRESCGLGLP